MPEETTETTTEGVALDTVAGYEPSGVTPDGVAEVIYQSDTDDYLLKDQQIVQLHGRIVLIQFLQAKLQLLDMLHLQRLQVSGRLQEF